MNLVPNKQYDWNTNVIGKDGNIQFVFILLRNCKDCYMPIYEYFRDVGFHNLPSLTPTYEDNDGMFLNWLHAKFDISIRNKSQLSCYNLEVLYRYWLIEQEQPDNEWLYIWNFDNNMDIWTGTKIIRYLKSLDRKVIVTSYNHLYTTNNLLRPDCCFIPWNGKLERLDERTDRTIREGNNVPKLYRANEFFRDLD